MTPALNSVHCADALALCRELPEASVNCVVTSPPYYALRNYGVEGQIGLEETPATYVEKLVMLFREIWRVLRDDGTAWVNLGDSYANDDKWGGTTSGKHANGLHGQTGIGREKKVTGLRSKSLMGIPWRVAFALQDDGWILRSDCIWSKPNPMPESVTDRPTKAHEYIFLLTKQGDYWYDQEAVREPCTPNTINRLKSGPKKGIGTPGHKNTFVRNDSNTKDWTEADIALGANLRSVWTIPTEPNSFAHFATFPRKLVERCVLAGCPSRVCAKCGAPWIRIVEKTTHFEGGSGKAGRTAEEVNSNGKWAGKQYGKNIKLGPVVSTSTLGFSPTCDCQSDTRPGVVFDPFMGSGTVALVARALGRNYIGGDLNPAYVKLANDRLSAPFTPPLFDLDAPAAQRAETLPLPFDEAE